MTPVAAGLVRSPEEMPGWTFDFGLWKGGPIEVPRPDVSYDPKRSEPSLPLVFTPPLRLYRAAGGLDEGIGPRYVKSAQGAEQRGDRYEGIGPRYVDDGDGPRHVKVSPVSGTIAGESVIVVALSSRELGVARRVDATRSR